jgi:hypothetical protein
VVGKLRKSKNRISGIKHKRKATISHKCVSHGHSITARSARRGHCPKAMDYEELKKYSKQEGGRREKVNNDSFISHHPQLF